MLSPGYPPEMPQFARGLRAVGARVIGVGDSPVSNLAAPAREALADYHQVKSFADEDAVVADAVAIAGRVKLERIVCLWEPLMVMAARIRERLGLPGMTVAETLPFRDKETMKQVLDRAGIRTPRHARADRVEQVVEAAERIGYPIIVKPIAGAGSADTHRVDDRAGLEAVLGRIRHVREVSVEEFIEGEEFTFDTVCANGEIVFYNICSYRPRPLLARQLEWVSPQTIALRNPDVPYLAQGKKLAQDVLRAMNFKSGFTHMEWHLKADGEAVFGEIAARPPGAFTVDIMNFASDIDLFRGWAEVEIHGRFTQPIERRYNCASIFKRAQGQGRIQRIEGLGGLMAEFGPHIVNVDLLPVGTPRRDWLQTLISDGMVVVRHADLATTIQMADRIGTDLRILAG
jgi:biotin carboxylase